MVYCHVAVTADEWKLPHLSYSKARPFRRAFFQLEYMSVSEKRGWMPKAPMSDWLMTVWARWPGTLLLQSLLVLDSLRGHLVNSIRVRLQELHTDTVVSLGGLMFVPQPLDASVNKPAIQGQCLAAVCIMDGRRRNQEVIHSDTVPVDPGSIELGAVRTEHSEILECWNSKRA